MKTKLLLIAIVSFALVSCETMNVKGSIGYVDPNTGAKAGMTFDQDRKAGWWVRLPWGGAAGVGVAVIEGEIPIAPEK